MTPEQLKASILQYAFEGKLVEQISSETPSISIVNDIRAEQERLIKAKEIKREKIDTSIQYEDELPDGWCVAKLGELTRVVTKQTGFDYSKTIKPNLIEYKAENTIPLVQTKNFKGKTFNLDTDYYIPMDIAKEFPKILLDGKCLLLSIVGASIGNVGLYELKELGMIGGAICKVQLINDLFYDYLFYYLQSPFGQNEIRKNFKATAQGTITVQDVREIIVKIPPLEEQHRIVAKIEELLPFVDRYAVSYEKLEQFNIKFPEDMKKSILQYAIQGKLVEQRPEEGTAEELYKAIQEEKQKLIKEGKIKKEKPLAEISEDEIPFDIPDSWKWCRLSQIIDVRDGTHDSPKYVPEGIPLVTSKNLSNGTIDYSNIKYITQEDADKINERSAVNDNDILFAMIGSIGNPVLVKKEREFCIKNMALFKKYDNTNIDMNFMYWFFLYAQYALKAEASGGVQSFISLGRFREYLTPLPPYEEQGRIVAKIKELLPFCERLIK